MGRYLTKYIRSRRQQIADSNSSKAPPQFLSYNLHFLSAHFYFEHSCQYIYDFWSSVPVFSCFLLMLTFIFSLQIPFSLSFSLLQRSAHQGGRIFHKRRPWDSGRAEDKLSKPTKNFANVIKRKRVTSPAKSPSKGNQPDQTEKQNNNICLKL